MGYRLAPMDVLTWAKHYHGSPFHAMLCDPPYHLTSIVKRFGKKGSAPAKHGKDGAFARASRGFMGRIWDGGDIAFDPDTWSALGQHLYPGAFGMAFASSRGWHRLAVAIEDAGFIIHPSIFGWAQGMGFPKATRIKGHDDFKGHRYGAQALKPSLEPIIIFQKPYDGRPLDNILNSGAGTINIDGGRLSTSDKLLPGGVMRPMTGDSREGKSLGFFNGKQRTYDPKGGRWPANVYLQHTPLCQIVGYRETKGYTINRFVDGAKPWGKGAGHKYKSEKIAGGQEAIYACVPTCPVRLLGHQQPIARSSGDYNKGGTFIGDNLGPTSIPIDGLESAQYSDNGDAARFFYNADWQLEKSDPMFYCAKASRREREAGLDGFDAQEVPYAKYRKNVRSTKSIVNKYPDGTDRPMNEVVNSHPTVKPISLATWLATLLLPPAAYAPRRIMVPFAGVASEMIGAVLAGWESVLGIESEAEYVAIGNVRLKYWAGATFSRR